MNDAVVRRGFDEAQTPGEAYSHQEHHGQLYPVVAVKVYLGQQVAEADTQERPGGEGQCAAYRVGLVIQQAHAPGAIAERLARGHEEAPRLLLAHQGAP